MSDFKTEMIKAIDKLIEEGKIIDKIPDTNPNRQLNRSIYFKANIYHPIKEEIKEFDNLCNYGCCK